MTSIAIGRKDGEWKAVILEGNGTPQDDKKTVITLNADHLASDEQLIAQLPPAYAQQLDADDATLVIIR